MGFDKSFPSNGVAPPATPTFQVNPNPAPIIPGFYHGFDTPAQPPQSGVTGTMSVSFSLNNTSPAFQSFSPSVSNLTVTLPNGTSIPLATQSASVLLRNTNSAGVFPVQILDATGALIGWSLPGSTIPTFLESNATQAGQWRVCTGNRAYDNGFYEWGTTYQFQSTSALAANQMNSIGTHLLDAELGIFTDIVLANASSTPAAFRVKDGAFQIGAVGTALTVIGAAANAMDTATNGASEVLIGYAGASNPTVASYTINTSTLALTQAANKVGAAKTTTFIGMDTIATSNNILVYSESTTNKAWIAMISGTGAGLTHNAAVQWSATTTMLAVQVAGLSATLAHGVYWDGSTIYLNRSTIAATVPTPGTQSTIASRSHLSNSFTSTIQIVKVDATHSLAVYPGVNSNANARGGTVYGNFITDTGSAITQNEVRLTDDFLTTLPTATRILVYTAAYKGVNGTINLVFSDGACFKMAIVKVLNGTPIISPLIDINLRGPLWNISGSTVPYVTVPRAFKGASGSYLLPIPQWVGETALQADFTTAGTNEASVVFSPICIAPT